MALNSIDYIIYRELHKAKCIPPNPDVLELGEANWYGDMKLTQLTEAIREYAAPECRLDLIKKLEKLLKQEDPDTSGGIYFDIAKIFYRTFLNYRSIEAIDFDGTAQAMRYDLNEPVPLEKRYHVIINTGTAEHIFNVFQFFKTVHERTLPGGLMIHAIPFTGWLDHGFYNFNPTFVADLAVTNRYQMLLWIYGELNPPKVVQLTNIEQVHAMAQKRELGGNSLQYAVLRKAGDEAPFSIPMQGIYARRVSGEAARDWVEMR
jgi:hypothetical protein